MSAGEAGALTQLPGRRVVSVAGAHRIPFLEGLVTQRVDDLAPGDLRYGALLTPQGKIVTTMMIFAFDDMLQLDVPEEAADELIKRLSVYRLRAAVTFERTDEVVAVGPDGCGGVSDPRAAGLGERLVTDRADEDGAALEAYHRARIAAGVPEAGLDFGFGEAFPHDANMDVVHGADFTKGCFVGQEVVSRMRHRGTARRRTVIVSSDAALPVAGTPITAGGAPIGAMGFSVGGEGLAIVRIDKAGPNAEADGTPVRLAVPPGAPFHLAGAAFAG